MIYSKSTFLDQIYIYIIKGKFTKRVTYINLCPKISYPKMLCKSVDMVLKDSNISNYSKVLKVLNVCNYSNVLNYWNVWKVSNVLNKQWCNIYTDKNKMIKKEIIYEK